MVFSSGSCIMGNVGSRVYGSPHILGTDTQGISAKMFCLLTCSLFNCLSLGQPFNQSNKSQHIFSCFNIFLYLERDLLDISWLEEHKLDHIFYVVLQYQTSERECKKTKKNFHTVYDIIKTYNHITSSLTVQIASKNLEHHDFLLSPLFQHRYATND